jgi:uncharacterized membrane protein YgaE (UPF0421/DUF939 family)
MNKALGIILLIAGIFAIFMGISFKMQWGVMMNDQITIIQANILQIVHQRYLMGVLCIVGSFICFALNQVIIPVESHSQQQVEKLNNPIEASSISTNDKGIPRIKGETDNEYWERVKKIREILKS